MDRKMMTLNESELATVSGAKKSPSFSGKLTLVNASPITVTGANVAEILQEVGCHGSADVQLAQGNASDISIG